MDDPCRSPKRFAGLHTPVIFVQNVVTDLLLGLKLHGVFAEFDGFDMGRAVSGGHVRRPSDFT